MQQKTLDLSQTEIFVLDEAAMVVVPVVVSAAMAFFIIFLVGVADSHIEVLPRMGPQDVEASIITGDARMPWNRTGNRNSAHGRAPAFAANRARARAGHVRCD